MEIILGVRDFGKISSAEVNISNFSVFVGNNNSGKTYMMQLIYGIRENLRKYTHDFESSHLLGIKQDAENGKVILDFLSAQQLEAYLNEILSKNKEKIIADTFNEKIEIGKLYLKFLWNKEEQMEYLAWDSDDTAENKELLKENLFGDSEAKTELMERLLPLALEKNNKVRFLIVNRIFNGQKESFRVTINLSLGKGPKYELVIGSMLDWIFGERNDTLFLPASRTGLLMLYKEFFAHKTDELVKVLTSDGEKKNSNALKMGLTQPVYEFIRFVQTFTFDAQLEGKYGDLVQFIETHLIDGKLLLENGNQVLYQENSTDKAIPLYLSSSMINELTPVLYALQSPQHPSYLIWDEIETSMHPQKQIELIRLLSRMNNQGISLIVSTHSDTMAIKLNNLCRISYSDDLKLRHDEILAKSGLEEKDLLKNKIYAYQFINRADGKSEVLELPFNEFTGYEFTLFNDSVEKLFLETKLIME